MRLIKMFGLAAIAAVAAMAFVGATSAMATFDTVVCNKDNGTLGCTDVAKTVHAIAKNGQLLTGEASTNVTCKESLLSGTLLGLAKPQQIHPFELKYSGCTTFFGVFSCTVSTTHVGLLDVLKTKANAGTVVDLETEGKFTEVNVNCLGGGVNCTYAGKGLEGTASGAPTETNGVVSYVEQTVLNVGGSNCPASGKLDAKFVSLAPLYIKS